MSGNTGRTQAGRAFRAVLTPHRSLGPNGFLIVMGLLSGLSFVAGMAFLAIGAWPVTGFLGLDVALVYLAFRLNTRSGRLMETVEVDRDVVAITRIHPSGRSEVFTFNPAWVRVDLHEGHDGRNELRLRHHRRELTFARFLTDGERREFALALMGALMEARGGVRI